MTADVVLVGGGLANGLIALRLRELRPEVDVLLLERAPQVGGRHTWSFHEGDLTPEQHSWVKTLIAHSWARHEVRFPAYRREIPARYLSVTSESLGDAVSRTLGDALRTGTEVRELTSREVVLSSGERVKAGAVIDGRGQPDPGHLELAFQKFLGQTLVLEHDHDLSGPILMDATVPQVDGFRFVYTLPFGPRRLLVEDTRYSDGPDFDRDELRHGIEAYARDRGWSVTGVEEEEEGSLPLVLSGDIEGLWDASGPGVARSGMRAGLFHPTTGYSLPEAVRLADAVAGSSGQDPATLYALTRGRSLEAWRRTGFFRLLNRMLFRAAEPSERYRVLEHFYRRPEGTIARFYAGRPTLRDKARVLSGRPPVPVGRALRAAWGGGTMAREETR